MSSPSAQDSAYGGTPPLSDADAAFEKQLHNYLISKGISPEIAVQVTGASVVESVWELERAATPVEEAIEESEEERSHSASPCPSAGEDDSAAVVDDSMALFEHISKHFTIDQRTGVLWTISSKAREYLTPWNVEFLQLHGVVIALSLGSACVSLCRLDRPTAAEALGRFTVRLLGESMFRVAVAYYSTWVSEEGERLENVKFIVKDCVVLLRDEECEDVARQLERLAGRELRLL